MRLQVRVACMLALMVVSIACDAQSKKEVIALQSTAMDSMSSVMERQHDAIVKATARIQELQDKSSACDRLNATQQARYDSARSAHGLAYRKLLRELDSLYVQHRTVSSSMQRLGGGLQGYTCVMPFSMRSLPDTLALTFSGSDPLISVITFRIIDWRGTEIHKETVELLKQEEIMQDDEKQRLLISIRVQAFFQDKRFHYPPIDTSRDRKHTGDRANGMTYPMEDMAWDALRFDAHTSSFTYPVNEHESRTIAFSSKLKKVVRLDPIAN